VGIADATHDVASGSKPYHVAELENQTNQHVPDFALAAKVTLPDPSGPPSPPLALVASATAPLTAEGPAGPVSTPYWARSAADSPPLLIAPSRTFCMAVDSNDWAWTS
jgi:hypothetical protein